MAEHAGDGPPVVRFGVYEVDFRSGDVRKRGARVRLQPQPLRVLELLLSRPGHLIAREEFRQRLWPSDTYVDFDHGLNKAVNRLREILGDSADSPRFIETLPKRGYRFIASVEVVADAPAPLPTLRDPGPPAPDTPAAEPERPPAPASGPLVASAPIEAPAVARSQPSSESVRRNRTGVWGRGLLALALLGLGSAWAWQRVSRPTADSARTVLAVLPFVNIAGDVDQEYFSDGMTEEMILQLSGLRPDRLGVIARTSAMHYKGKQMRVDQIAGELGVDYVLEGTVRRSGSRVRITASLVRRDDQTPLWSESFERDVAGVFEIQRDVAQRIATSLAIELLPSEVGPLAAATRTNADAYESYLRGRHLWNKRTPPDLEQALTLLQDSVAKGPAYVPAQAALADALNVLPWYGLRPPKESYPRSKEIATRAIGLDEGSAAAHTALAYAHHYFDWNWADAEREYARALALNPNYAQAHQWLAAHWAEMGRTDLALEQERQAQALDPRSLVVNAAIGWIQYLGRRYPEAVEQLERTLALDPRFVPAHLWLGQTLEAMGRPDEAIRHYQEVRRIAGSAPTGLGELARGYALSGDEAAARRELAALEAMAKTRYVEADLFARVFDGLGDRDATLDWLERGYDERAAKMVLIGVDPQYDRLRDAPRFQALIKRLNLPDAPPR